MILRNRVSTVLLTMVALLPLQASATPQAAQPGTPGGLDDTGWSSLKEAVGKAIGEQANLVASTGNVGDRFGYSVAVSGDTALVGAPFDGSIGTFPPIGAAYVFTRNGSTWTQQARLTAPDRASNDQFGFSVALSGDTALIGTPFDGSVGMSTHGSVYVYSRNGTSWTLQAKLLAPDRSAGDQFGIATALSGETALIGAWTDDVGGIGDRGSVYVFTRSGTTWTQQAQLAAADGGAGDRFGRSVALSGETALVGAFSDDIGTSTEQGSAYVFTRSGTNWSEQAKLVAADGATGDSFGVSVAIAGDTALVGAPLDDFGSIRDQGSAYVFGRSGTVWTQQAKLVAADGAGSDFFATSVALAEGTALVGSTGDDIGPMPNRGSVYMLTLSGSTWTQQTKLLGSRDSFGNAAALSGNTAVIGAEFDNVGSNLDQGSAYVFTIDTERTTTTIDSALPDPSQAGDGVLVDVDVNGTSTTPAGGIITVTASTGESCIASTPAASNGVAARFACTVRFDSVGQRNLVATFTGSLTHANSVSAAEPHAVATTLTLSPSSLGEGTFGVPYSQSVSASGPGSSAPYAYAVSSGALPMGLSIATAGGVIEGTPAATGVFTFTVTATDSSTMEVGGPFSGSQTYSIAIMRADQATLTATASPSSVPLGGSSMLGTAGGSGSGMVDFSVTAGATNCAVNGNILTGIATGTCTITATKAADANFNAATATVDVVVQPGTDLEVSLQDASPNALPGGAVEYDVRVANAGMAPVQSARLQLPLAAGLADALWTCAPVQGANCPEAAGSGPIDQAIDLPIASVLRYVFSARVTAPPGATITSTANVAPPPGVTETDAADNTATDTNTVLSDGIFGDGFESAPTAISVPIRGE